MNIRIRKYVGKTMFNKRRFLAIGLAFTVVATAIPADLSNAKTKTPSLTGKKSVTVDKSTTLQVKANATTIKKVTWKSSNKKIATAKAKGKLKCKITVKESSTKKTTNKINLNHTSVTKFEDVDSVFQFDYSDNWSIVSEEFDLYDIWAERVILQNSRRVNMFSAFLTCFFNNFIIKL